MAEGRFHAGWLEQHRVSLERVERTSIVGIGHVMAEVDALLARLRDPERALAIGAPAPPGVLLWGLPGLGKTLVARYIAASIDPSIPMYELGPDELTPARLRGMLRYLATAHERSVVYLDEIDQWAMDRQYYGHSPETRLLLAAALAALDGLVPASGPILIAASNQSPDQLDAALMRAGRFGVRIQFDHPDRSEREALLRLFLDGRGTDDIDLADAAALSHGLTPADLRASVDNAAGLALAADRDRIEAVDLLSALRRVGDIRPPDRAVDVSARRRIAVHEAGHTAATVALLGPEKVRSVRLLGDHGSTVTGDDETPALILTDDLLLDQLVVAMAGLVAEREILGSGSLGGTRDISGATRLAISRLDAGLEPNVPPVSLDAFGDRPPEILYSLFATEVATMLQVARAGAARVVAANIEAIDRFAIELEQADDLSGDRLAKAIDRAGFVTPDEIRLPRPASWTTRRPGL